MLAYSEWKILNLAVKKKRLKKKYKKLYHYNHPSFRDYVMSFRKPGKGLTTGDLNLAFSSIYTDVILEEEFMRTNWLLQHIGKA